MFQDHTWGGRNVTDYWTQRNIFKQNIQEQIEERKQKKNTSIYKAKIVLYKYHSQLSMITPNIYRDQDKASHPLILQGTVPPGNHNSG